MKSLKEAFQTVQKKNTNVNNPGLVSEDYRTGIELFSLFRECIKNRVERWASFEDRHANLEGEGVVYSLVAIWYSYRSLAAAKPVFCTGACGIIHNRRPENVSTGLLR